MALSRDPKSRLLTLAIALLLLAGSFLGLPASAPYDPMSAGEGHVTAPDHPEGESFNPNQLKGITAADPATGIDLVAAPGPNNMGDARLSYPIQIPPGRAGAQPLVSVQYSSGGGNGWVGVGWDVSAPTISLDTRWGVPRYDDRLETESYLLGSQQLTPQAKGEFAPRAAERVFHPRVQGSFERIIRHGDNPADYWWEVTDKQGTVSVYGGDPNAVLADADGDVAVWALRETRDTNGNFVRYHYDKVEDGGVPNATVPGVELYPSKITYTGHGTTEGRYSVTFVRDRQRTEPRRPDVQIDARFGFKKVTADLLRRIEVKLDDDLIRAYELNYRTGAFDKTLLASVSQFDRNNDLFTTHTFDYFDDIRGADGQYDAFAQAVEWDVADDGLGVDIRDGEAGALNASTSTGVGGHLYVGYNPSSPNKSNSAGVKVGFNSGSSDGLLSLTDVDGDELPDKVFRSGGDIYYRRNLSGPTGDPRFAETPVKLNGLPAISAESSLSGTVGIESYFGVAAQLDYVSTTTTSDRYFTDVNADGITDLVNNGGVLFGRLDANGHPVYGDNSADTGVPVGDGAASGSFVGDRTAEFERQVDRFPLLDSVRRWVAPYDGTVRVDGNVTLLPDNSPERAAYTKADGVRVAIQHKGDELWAQRIGPDDHFAFTPTNVGSIQVRKGEALYFRVQSVLDGRFDSVGWDPVVTYLGIGPGTDVNGLPVDVFRASADFTLGGRPSVVTAPLNGTLRLTGDVTKTAPTTDDVTVEITRGGAVVHSQVLGRAAAGTAAIDVEIPVTAQDQLSWRLRVDSPVDATTLSWTPKAHYTAAEGVESVVDAQGNPTLVIHPPYELDLYPVTTLTAPQAAYTAPADGTLTVTPALAFDFAGQTPDTSAVFTVKKRGALLAKRVVPIVGGVPDAQPVTVDVAAGDELFFDFATRDTTLPARLVGHSATADDGNGPVTVPTALHAAAEQGAFPAPFRGWGAIGYQGNRDRATTPIIESELVLDESYRDQLPEGPTEDDVDDFRSNPVVAAPRVVVFVPLPAQNRWAGGDDNTWVAATGASSSRYGLDTIDVLTDGDIAGATAVSRRGRTQQISTTFSAGIPGVPIGAGGSLSLGDSTGELDFFDLNGDRFPDVIGSAGVQYTDPDGGLGDTRGSVGGAVRESDSLAYSVSANGGSPARTSATARGVDAPAGDLTANTAESGAEMPSLGVGGNLGGGQSDAGHDLIDINGDGLPDKVFANGTAALNLGYSFAGAEQWPGGPVNEGETTNGGVNLGFNTSYYGFAGGVSAALGTSVTNASFQDMNGDGLADRVFTNGDQPVGVAINTGSGFTAPTPFRGALADIGRDGNATLGGGVYFTFGFCFVFGCLVFNPGADVSTGVGRTEVALRDVNGDSYVDHLRSANDGQFVVAENKTGRTNLLRSVQRPMGSRVDLEYTRSGNTADQPASRWVLSRSALHDGHPGDGVDSQVSTFRYENGRYDRLEREFYGYGRVISEVRDAANDVYRATTTDYRTDGFATKGLVSRTLVADAQGRPYLETVNTYQLRPEAAGAVFPMLTRTDRHFYEGNPQPGKSTYTELAYDEYGNLTRSFDAADSGTADDSETLFGYTSDVQACRDRHIVGIADSLREGGTAPAVELRHRESTIDCTTGDTVAVKEFLDATPAVTDLEHFPDGNLKKVTGPPNKDGERYTLTYTYDSVVGVHVESVEDIFGYRSSKTYDLGFAQPTLVVDENNQQVRYRYDSVGRVDDVTGPHELGTDRLTIDFEYHPEAATPYAVTRHVDRTATDYRDDTIDTIQFSDGIGRIIQSKQDGTVAEVAGAQPADVMIVSGRTAVDFLGRVVERFYPVTEDKGAANTTFHNAFDTVAPTRLAYDVLDRTTQSTLPDDTVTTLAYDFGADRGGITRFRSVATDGNGKQKHSFTDVRKLTTAFREFNAGATIWTSYGYDALGQLTSITDDKGNLTKVQYDTFGRRVVVDSPDHGRTELVHDLAGNVTRKITSVLRAGNQAVDYDYDYTRLAGIRYPTFTANNVTYTYGGPNAPDNTANRIAQVRDAAGTVVRAYGPLGETVRETRAVTALVTPARTYTTEFRHDSFNRVLSMTYPDGEVLTYGYDSGGQVNRATGRKGDFDYTYLARLDYDKFGQRLLQETGTGVRTTYAYDPEVRQLANLKSQLADGYQFQDLTYTYDNVGNVTSLTNAVALPHGKPVGGPSRQTYTYDDLYRLTSASGQYQDKDNKLDRYTLALSYDSIHNISAKHQRHEIVVQPGAAGPLQVDPVAATEEPGPTDDALLPPLGPIEEPEAAPDDGNAQEQKETTYDYAYAYASGKPHAASKIGPITHGYDANGNLIDTVNTEAPAPGKRRQLIWDEENRLACNQDHNRNETLAQNPASCGTPRQPATVHYIYDDVGNRVVKNSGQQHIYPNRTFSERNGTGFKHVFIGDVRLATKTVKPEPSYENHQFFFHADHLGSASYVTDEHGWLTEHLEYFASGETWVEENPAQPTPGPYRYSSKELDEETGYYFYGARYYNPRTQMWINPDPALSAYLDGGPAGGVYQPANLAAYTYAHNNPVKYTDPNGQILESAWDAVSLGIGVASFIHNVREGNGWDAALDAVGIVADGVALAVPVVPGGAGAAIKAGRAADKGIDALRAADRAKDTANAVDNARTATNAADTAGDVKKATNAAPPCPVANSFTPETPVLMADGSRQKIEDVEVGDLVVATDPETGETSARPVTALIVGDGSKHLVEITVETGVVIATDQHPFWVADDGAWVDAADLAAGHLLRTPDGDLVEVVGVREYTAPARVHNLTVDGVHTYYVQAGAADLLVHNCGADKIKDFRQSAQVGKGKNIAHADVNIDGLPRDFVGVSGSHQYKGASSMPTSPTLDRGPPEIARAADSEWKILEDISGRLRSSGKTDAAGTIHLTSERAVCPSCQSVVKAFEREFPNIKVTFSDLGVAGRGGHRH